MKILLKLAFLSIYLNYCEPGADEKKLFEKKKSFF